MRHVNPGTVPAGYARSMPVCGRCVKCHPGKAWGGDEACRVQQCPCHRREET